MQKEYCATISVKNNKMDECSEAAKANADRNLSTLNAIDEVLMAIAYGIKKRVKHALYRTFPGSKSLAILELSEDDRHVVDAYLKQISESIRDSSITFRNRRIAQKVHQGRVPEWFGEALFHKGQSKPSELAKWLYHKYFKTS